MSVNTTLPVSTPLQQLLTNKELLQVPKVGELVRGTILSISPREILVDIAGYKTGVIRGYELTEKGAALAQLQIGDQLEATVVDLENEEDTVELSLRFAKQLQAWDVGLQAKQQEELLNIKIIGANAGGLMGNWQGMTGFLPVSQLAPEHYPRVIGADKSKILDRLRTLIGTTIRAKILDCDPQEEKLIFSEKSVWEEEQKDLIAKYKPGDIVEGTISALADFGAFIAFENLEGLVHISEIAWQRLDNPGDILKIGDKVRAQILNIQGSKIFLSIRALVDDPWKKVVERYQVGQTVQGKVLKVNPFGLFVELDPEIHGLAHVSALKIAAGQSVEEQIKPGELRTFQVVSLEPEHHRLGLSEKALQPETTQASQEKTGVSNTTTATSIDQAPDLVNMDTTPSAPLPPEETAATA